MIFDILTIFPEFLNSPFEEGILRRAKAKGQIKTNIINIRDFATGPHQMTDDRPFGGGEGMVMKPEPLAAAVNSCKKGKDTGKVILMSPQGRRYTQRVAEEFATHDHLILVCGRYEGVDERFLQNFVDEEISLGDFILTGGELAAMVVVDSVTRLLPNVLGCSESVTKDTFSRKLLKHPQYTRPRRFMDEDVPAELLSGNHENIEKYRFVESVKQTFNKRPDLLADETFDKTEIELLAQHGLLDRVRQLQDEVRKRDE